MAKKSNNPKSKNQATKIRRITAQDETKAASKTAAPKVAKKPAVNSTKPKADKAKSGKKLNKVSRIFKSIAAYFKGAWFEIRQVRWPNRRTTWALTFAVIAFSVFFLVLIILLDYGFQWIFEQILG